MAGTSEAVAQSCSVKKVFSETGTGGFPVNFAKFLRTPFLTEHLRWLLSAHEKGRFIGSVTAHYSHFHITGYRGVFSSLSRSKVTVR